MNQGFILNVAPTGMIPTREMTPEVPLTPGEIVRQVCEAATLGANMVHLHARDPGTGTPTHRKSVYAGIIGGIRRRFPDLVLCVSTSGRNGADLGQRSEVLDLEGDLKPDFASLTLSSLNFNRQASVNPPDMIQDLARRMQERGIRPEMELFDLGMINYARYLIRKGLVRPPYYFNIILGNIACAQPDLLTLGLMARELPEGSLWSVGGVGDCQFRMNTVALAAGGGVRVGLEDNIWYDEARTRLATNRDLVERVLVVAKALGKRPWTHVEARERLGAAR